MRRGLTEIVVDENNIFIFHEQFLDKDISVVIAHSHMFSMFSPCFLRSITLGWVPGNVY